MSRVVNVSFVAVYAFPVGAMGVAMAGLLTFLTCPIMEGLFRKEYVSLHGSGNGSIGFRSKF